MAADDEETKEPPKPLPEEVVVALAGARSAKRKDDPRGRWLALVPVVVAAVFLALLMPRTAIPDAIPMPRVDTGVLVQVALADDRMAREAEATRLPTDILAVGSALRAYKVTEAHETEPRVLADAKAKITGSLNELGARPGITEELLALRALQTRHFLDALARWEASGETTADLAELGGSFLDRLQEAGWATSIPRRVLLDDAERRVAFKLVWNALLEVDRRPAFALSRDEQRAIHAFYLSHPHPGDAQRSLVAMQRRAATTPAECGKVAAEEARQAELWRIEKMKRLGALDPDYPLAYALGIGFYRAGRYDLAADAFSAWLNAHPSGPYSLRATNYLKAAVAAGGA